ncbi:YfdX family protein [Acetobacter sp. AN02]|uniref:YfdX family protein n=1 Tax=Acetobacter sp. AN02 TaxID=2894186 RepID=UPI0024345D92|nr:YfdX family protein [Acetobacter sp. AN02]MDG6093573.1 YfdX family protein [Acetobacter sp. AN02]
MRLSSSIAIVAALSFTPVAASAEGVMQKIHDRYEQGRADHSFRHLSKDGQRAIDDILQARDLLAAGKTTQAVPLITDAGKRLEAAGKARLKFNAAEAALHRVPQHPAPAGHTATTQPTDWIPVGAEFIVTDEMAPEKKAALTTANTQIRQGNTAQASQTVQVVGQDAALIIALAPLQQTQGAVNRAAALAEGDDATSAAAALSSALDGLVFIADEEVDTLAPAGKNTGTNTGKNTAAKAPAAPAHAAPAPAAN